MLKDKIKIILGELAETLPDNLIERDSSLDQSFLQSRINKAITIIGPRRAGKTWFMYQFMNSLIKRGKTVDDFLYINFEDERLQPLAADNFQLILDAWFELHGLKKKPLIFFDEIQNIDGWDKFIRRLIDQGYRVVITGSNSKLLSSEIATTLRGRTLTYEIFPFSFKEFLKFKGITPSSKLIFSKERHLLASLFDQYLYCGGYPEIVLTDDKLTQNNIAQDYFNTIFYRDLVERYKITNTQLLRHWMHLLLENISSLISYRKAENDFKSRGMQVSSSTLSKFAGYLEEAFFGTFLEIHSESVRKRQTNPKKFYLVDQGLHNFLTLSFSENKGRLLENTVFLELRRLKINTAYYKTKTGREIDFITSENGNEQLIQVCYDINHLETAEREKRALLKGMDELNHVEGLILTNDYKAELEINGKQVHLRPVYEWLLGEMNFN